MFCLKWWKMPKRVLCCFMQLFATKSKCSITVSDYRRRSLSPLSLSLLANFGSKDAINSIGNFQIGFQTTDALFQRCSITPRRRTHSMSSNGTNAQNGNGVHKEENGTLNSLDKPKAKPPSVTLPVCTNYS